MKNANDLREDVAEYYTQVARSGGCGCGCDCAPADEAAKGYSAEDLAAAPAGSNLGLGCGNPLALASLRPGERVLDLGSGAGFDCFLAARRVGETGRVIGVDMTRDMLARAREKAAAGGYENVEFRLGEIENLPLADESVDVVISNCVVNLSPRKERVFAEALRVLRPGGRLAISDMIRVGELPASLGQDTRAYCECVSGAASAQETRAWLEAAGFRNVEIRVGQAAPGQEWVASSRIEARKP